MGKYFTNKEVAEELKSYTKSDLINFICFDLFAYIRNENWEWLLLKRKNRIRLAKQTKKIDAMEQAGEEHQTALQKLCDYKKELVEKYGVNGNLKFLDLPAECRRQLMDLIDHEETTKQKYLKYLNKN